MTKATGSKIRHLLGVLEAMDIARERVEWRSVMCIWVTIDIQKPLERGDL
jgi:hypothetical protein